MLATVHLLTGAMIGATVPSNAAIVIAALFSHYLLDALPHIDPDTFPPTKGKYTKKQIAVFCIDGISTIVLAAVFYHYRQRWFPIILGGVVAQLPDLLIPLERFPFFSPLKKVHDLFHWDKSRANQWSCYIAGIATQAMISLVALWIIQGK